MACSVGARNLEDWYIFDRQHLAYCGKKSVLAAASGRHSIGSQQERDGPVRRHFRDGAYRNRT